MKVPEQDGEAAMRELEEDARARALVEQERQHLARLELSTVDDDALIAAMRRVPPPGWPT